MQPPALPSELPCFGNFWVCSDVNFYNWAKREGESSKLMGERESERDTGLERKKERGGDKILNELCL